MATSFSGSFPTLCGMRRDSVGGNCSVTAPNYEREIASANCLAAPAPATHGDACWEAVGGSRIRETAQKSRIATPLLYCCYAVFAHLLRRLR